MVGDAESRLKKAYDQIIKDNTLNNVFSESSKITSKDIILIRKSWNVISLRRACNIAEQHDLTIMIVSPTTLTLYPF